MAEFVGAFAASHAPLIARDWDKLAPASREIITSDFRELGKRLTPLGAERAGNADGSIPEWTGGLPTNAGSKDGAGFLSNPYAAEKPLFVIDAKNSTASSISIVSTSPILRPRQVTASVSGLKRCPWQTSQGTFTSGRKLMPIVRTPCPSHAGQRPSPVLNEKRDAL